MAFSKWTIKMKCSQKKKKWCLYNRYSY